MTATSATTVVDAYQYRVRFSRAETATVRRPRLLRGLLDTATHVAEIPCGPGHFLTDYAQAECTVTLVDASPVMLAAAVAHAVEAGLPGERTFPTAAYLQELKLPAEVDLVVAPNAALNQLACQSSLTGILSALRTAVRPGVEVLAQMACTHPGETVDTATFYDAARQVPARARWVVRGPGHRRSPTVSDDETVAGAQEYWQHYYAEQFHAGLGTENILAALMQIPPVNTWADLGCGSESMLWAIALRARRLVAVDIDEQRLQILRQFTAAERPRGVHTTVLRLCGRTDPDAFLTRCRSLAALIRADCLAGPLPTDPHLAPGSFELVTQFGLLGLCRNAEHFTTCFSAFHRLLAPGGWTAGANWVTRHPRGRVALTEQLYRVAATRAGAHLLLLNQIKSADPDFPTVWIYVGTTRRTPPCPPQPSLHHRGS